MNKRRQSKNDKLKNLTAKNYLFQAIDWWILETIFNKDTTKENLGFFETEVPRDNADTTCTTTSFLKGI